MSKGWKCGNGILWVLGDPRFVKSKFSHAVRKRRQKWQRVRRAGSPIIVLKIKQSKSIQAEGAREMLVSRAYAVCDPKIFGKAPLLLKKEFSVKNIIYLLYSLY